MADDELGPGTCPACGSSHVVHLVYGLPTPDSMERAPSWVRFAGCTIEPDMHNRECHSCGHSWLLLRARPTSRVREALVGRHASPSQTLPR